MGDTKSRVLIVEDEPSLQFMYKLKLEREGFEVATAANGVEGLAEAERFKPQLILLDLMMPEMGGEDMLTHLRAAEWGSNIRVVILTNLSKTEAPQTLRFLHVDRYIVKAHYTPMQLVEVVQEVLSGEHKTATAEGK